VIDERVRQLTREGVNDTVLVNRMLATCLALHACIPRRLIRADGMVRRIFWVCAVCRLMENMSEALRTGVGVPAVSRTFTCGRAFSRAF